MVKLSLEYIGEDTDPLLAFFMIGAETGEILNKNGMKYITNENSILACEKCGSKEASMKYYMKNGKLGIEVSGDDEERLTGYLKSFYEKRGFRVNIESVQKV